MKNGGSYVAGCTHKILLGDLRARFDLFRPMGCQRFRCHQPSDMSDTVYRYLTIAIGGQVARVDFRGDAGIGAANMGAAPAFWAQIADRNGDSRPRVQRLSKRLQRQGLHVVFDIGGLELVRGSGENAELAWRHGHWPRARKRSSVRHHINMD